MAHHQLYDDPASSTRFQYEAKASAIVSSSNQLEDATASVVSTSYADLTPASTFQPPFTHSTNVVYGGPSRPATARPSTSRRTKASSVIGGEGQKIICAISEGRGVSPIVGLAFINISTGETVLSQICDNQFYARTLNKLLVFDPTEILVVSTCGPPNKSKMYQVVEENIVGARMITVDRQYWCEETGREYLQDLAFEEDIEALKISIGGNYFATCCFSAVRKAGHAWHHPNRSAGSKVYRSVPFPSLCI